MIGGQEERERSGKNQAQSGEQEQGATVTNQSGDDSSILGVD